MYEALDREALAMCCCLKARVEAHNGAVSDRFSSGGGSWSRRHQQRHRLRVQLTGGTEEDGVMPLYLTNEVSPRIRLPPSAFPDEPLEFISHCEKALDP